MICNVIIKDHDHQCFRELREHNKFHPKPQNTRCKMTLDLGVTNGSMDGTIRRGGGVILPGNLLPGNKPDSRVRTGPIPWNQSRPPHCHWGYLGERFVQTAEMMAASFPRDRSAWGRWFWKSASNCLPRGCSHNVSGRTAFFSHLAVFFVRSVCSVFVGVLIYKIMLYRHIFS